MAKKETAASSLSGYTSERVFDGVRALKGAAARCQVERVKSAAGSTLKVGSIINEKIVVTARRSSKVLVKSD